MIDYLRRNLVAGLKTPPWSGLPGSLALLPLFAVGALLIGALAGLYRPGLLRSELLWLLPVTLFVFPALLEEAFFRGVLIPRDVAGRGRKAAWRHIVISTLLFVVWHPLNALTVNPTGRALFLDPAFLGITALLGLTCGYAYVVSRSLWQPIIIHWLTVLVWVTLLGGRNLLLEP